MDTRKNNELQIIYKAKLTEMDAILYGVGVERLRILYTRLSTIRYILFDLSH